MGLHRFAAPSFPLKLLAAVQTAHPTDCPDAAFWERSLRPQRLLPDSVQDLGVRASSKVNSNGACSRFYMILDALHLPSHDHSGTGVLPQRTAQSSAGFHAAHDAVCPRTRTASAVVKIFKYGCIFCARQPPVLLWAAATRRSSAVSDYKGAQTLACENSCPHREIGISRLFDP